MAFAKTVRTLVCELRKNDKGEYFHVTRVKPEDPKSNMMEAVDVRVMYTAIDPNEGEVIKPTQKGVYVNSEMVAELTAGIFKAMSSEERQEFMELIADDLETDDEANTGIEE